MTKKMLSVILAMGISFGLVGCGPNENKSYEAYEGEAQELLEEEDYGAFNESMGEVPEGEVLVPSLAGYEGGSLYGPFSVIQIGHSVRAEFSALAGTYEMTTLRAEESTEVTIDYAYQGTGGDLQLVLVMPDGARENILTRSDGEGQFEETGSQVFCLPEGQSTIELEAIEGKAGKVVLNIEGELEMNTADHSETNLLNWNLTF